MSITEPSFEDFLSFLTDSAINLQSETRDEAKVPLRFGATRVSIKLEGESREYLCQDRSRGCGDCCSCSLWSGDGDARRCGHGQHGRRRTQRLLLVATRLA